MDNEWWIKGVRGAIKVDRDEENEIIEKGKRMIKEIMKKNGIHPEDIICALFTITEDINSTSPGRILREMGLKEVPVLCTQEPVYKNSLPKTIRVLLLFYTKNNEIKHVYMGETKKLRPDLFKEV